LMYVHICYVMGYTKAKFVCRLTETSSYINDYSLRSLLILSTINLFDSLFHIAKMVKFPLMVLEALKTAIYPYLYNPANLILALTAPDCLNPPESTDWGEDLDPTER
jgi:hypothetical protein